MKPPRTLFSLGRPGTKSAAPTLEPGVAAESGSDTVVDGVEAPVAEVPFAQTPAELPMAEVPVESPAAEVAEAPVAGVADVANLVATEIDMRPLDAPVADAPRAVEIPDLAAVETAAVDAAGVADSADLAAAAVREPESLGTFDASAEESGYLCGACDVPLPVGATICAACGTPVAGAEIHEGADAFDSLSDIAAAGIVGAAVVDQRATVVPDVAAYDYPPADGSAPDPSAPDLPGREVAAPAAVLYTDNAGFEPLPPTPEGSWGITQPSFGGVGDDLVDPAPAQPSAWEGPAAASVVGGAATAEIAAGMALPASYDDPTVAASAVPVGAAASAPYAGSDASSMPYGTGAVTSSEQAKSKAPLWIAAAVAVVLVGLVGGILVATSGKSDDSNVQATQAVAPTTASTAKAAVTTVAPTTLKPANTAPSTTPPATASPTTAAAPTTVATTAPTVVATTQATVATTLPRQTTIITSPPTTEPVITPGSITSSQPNGAELRIPKGGRATIVLTNTGGRAASCAISVGSGNLSLDRNCSPSIPPGTAVTINVTANPGFEGAGSVTGLLEGIGPYNVPVFVKNG